MKIENVRQLIREGGAVGHIRHLSDDPDLTFGDLKDVIQNAAEGKLESVSEKLDGANLMFSWNPLEGGLKAARSTGEIKKGGLDASEIAEKFQGRGNVLDAFKNGFRILSKAVSILPEEIQEQVFESGKLWYSIELIYSGLRNTVSYDADNIVFHRDPVFRLTDEGDIKNENAPDGVNTLNSFIDKMQAAVSERNWKIRGPALVRLKKLSDGSIVQQAISQINSAMSISELDDGNSLQEYLFNMVVEEAQDLNLELNVVEAIAARIAKLHGAPTLTHIKKMVEPNQVSIVQDFIRAEKEIKGKIMYPIEQAVHKFAVEVLRGLESALIADSAAEVQRLRNELKNAIASIQSSGHEGAMNVLAKEMGKLQSVENIGSPMEGIVFMFKDKAYKFTGAFAPAHQILSLFTFGRKDIPTSIFKKESKRKQKGILLSEGGHAFVDVTSITLEELEVTWPMIDDDLKTLGVTNIHPIGTTWKKDVMGDVDIAGEFEGTRDELFEMASDLFGKDNVVKIGHNIISINFPITGKETNVQVDLMLGDPQYLTWSRYGPSPEPEHEEFSIARGVLRNLLLNIILRFAAKEEFSEKQTNFTRSKYAIDFDKGLFLIDQSKQGRSGNTLKKWRTINREFISSNPDEIVQFMFDDTKLKSESILRLEDLASVLRRNHRLGHLANDIMSAFISETELLSQKDSKMLGMNPQETLNLLRKL